MDLEGVRNFLTQKITYRVIAQKKKAQEKTKVFEDRRDAEK